MLELKYLDRLYSERYRDLYPDQPGGIDQLISFIDLAPTIINIVGGEIPKTCKDKLFRKNLKPERDYVFVAREEWTSVMIFREV